MDDPTRKVKRSGTVDTVLRTALQNHAKLSAMADAKANIVITISSIVLTLALSRLGDPTLRAAVMTLTAFTLAALVLAVLAVLPNFQRMKLSESDELPPDFNLLFFGHFTALSLDRYQREMQRVFTDEEEIYQVAVKDLWEAGTYLATKKYGFLRYSYASLLAGFVAASIIQVIVVTWA